MKLEGIQLPDDWRELVEQLVDADGLFTAVVVSDHELDKALKAGGWIDQNARGGTYGTPKLTLWWNTHRDYEDPPLLKHEWTYRMEYAPYEDDVWEEVFPSMWRAKGPFANTIRGMRDTLQGYAPAPTRIIKVETKETLLREEDEEYQ